MQKIKNPASPAGFDPDGNYPNMTVGAAGTATNAYRATRATQDGQGRDIASTYALKGEGGKLYKHTISLNNLRDENNQGVTFYAALFLPFDTPFTSDQYDEVIELLTNVAYRAKNYYPESEIQIFSGVIIGITVNGDQWLIQTYSTGANRKETTDFITAKKDLTDVVTEV